MSKQDQFSFDDLKYYIWFVSNQVYDKPGHPTTTWLDCINGNSAFGPFQTFEDAKNEAGQKNKAASPAGPTKGKWMVVGYRHNCLKPSVLFNE